MAARNISFYFGANIMNGRLAKFYAAFTQHLPRRNWFKFKSAHFDALLVPPRG